MASQTLRPHRSPSPSPGPATPVNPTNPAKLTRQSLGPPTSTGGSARGFAGLGISANGAFPAGISGAPRHVSSGVTMGHSVPTRETISPRPSGAGTATTPRAVSFASGPRPSSEFLPGGTLPKEARTPEAEQIDQWFKHLASWEATLEEMAAASTDQNFTEELGAIEQWFRVLSEAERTAALYSLLQHSTPVQIRFFLSVLHHMAQSDPMTALLSPNPNSAALMQAQMENKLSAGLKSPSAGGGSGFGGLPGSPGGYLAPEAEAKSQSRIKQNRISAPGTLQPSDRWQSQLDQVAERGASPALDSERSRSPALDGARPKSTDFQGKANQDRSPRHSGAFEAAAAQSPTITSPFLNNSSWASMTNTPLVPMFTDPKIDGMNAALNMANMNLANATGAGATGRVTLDDVRKYRRPTGAPSAPGSRNVSAQYNDDGEMIAPQAQQPGRSPLAASAFPNTWARSPTIADQFALGGLGIGGADPATLAGLGMNFANMNINPMMPNAAQMLALQAQQLSTAASFAQAGYGGLGVPRGAGVGAGGMGKPANGRRSPMLGKSHSPTPGAGAGGGGAGGGAGVAGPDDVDQKVLDDVGNWLRVLRLHKYTTNFEKSNWKEMVAMNDNDLQDKGVSAQGARTKFLKVFYNVRTKYDMPHPEGQEEYAPS